MALDGEWYSELGSHMSLKVGPDGILRGSFTSRTGRSTGPQGLVGLCDPLPASGRGAVLGWSVAWPDEHGVVASLASWSGQYFEQGERICAMWLLTRSAVVSDMWEATEVGQDVFTRRASGSG